jgi:hypothetical protein
MTKGILIYAHNNRSVDYALMSMASGGLAKKHLQVPVSLVTDQSTIDWMHESKIYTKANEIFENIIITPRPPTNNFRRLHDGIDHSTVAFINANRYSAWYVTPYDRTLLIDADFFIFSDTLGEYWDVDSDLMIGESINDIYDNKRLGYCDRYVSEVGIKLYWATTVMFTKNAYTKLFFDLVRVINENYQYFADTYRFDAKQYRNDIAFSIAKHILDGFETVDSGCLPPVLTLLDKDLLHDVNGDRLTVLVAHNLDENFCAATLHATDLHIMNKQSTVRNISKLLDLI